MSLWQAASQWLAMWGRGWNRFWFSPRLPHTLALVRLLGGSMLFYTHLVWARDLEGFFGPHAWIPPDLSRQQAAGSWAWSHLWFVQSTAALWALHVAALLVFAALAVGFFTSFVAPLAWLLAVSYCHRLNGALFGLDQINVTIAFCLAIGRSGDAYSLDCLWRKLRAQPVPEKSVWTNLAIRLLQLHLCIIYLFGGMGKLRGETWWIGDAFWYSIASYEYQSWDITWLAPYPALMSLVSHVTVFWETYYCALVWPRLTRPIALALAVLVHGGIAVFLGMPTFGMAMLIANLAFVPEAWVSAVVACLIGPIGRLHGRACGPVVDR
ncbi:MAG: hypothetical protein KatS3mg110_1168 [Pirellulaceae bacterium]|nr:MAG: hypothetical protein KatS3mg110_1168 [Pirellulaceae bacterium]